MAGAFLKSVEMILSRRASEAGLVDRFRPVNDDVGIEGMFQAKRMDVGMEGEGMCCCASHYYMSESSIVLVGRTNSRLLGFNTVEIHI